MKVKKNKHSKYYSRCCVVQALYQWQHNQQHPEEIIQAFIDQDQLQRSDRKYFKKLVNGILAKIPELDQLLLPHLDRELLALTPVELAILRLAIYELAFCSELPYKIIINEALEIAKDYGAEQSHKFVNAVLDSAASQLRAQER